LKYAHRTNTVAVAVDDVKPVFEDRLIARHRRHWYKERLLSDSIHRLSLVERILGRATR